MSWISTDFKTLSGAVFFLKRRVILNGTEKDDKESILRIDL